MPRRVKAEPPKGEAIELYEEGHSLGALAARYGVSATFMRGRLIDWGVHVRNRAEAAALRGPAGPPPMG